jgi:hypothetical protein
LSIENREKKVVKIKKEFKQLKFSIMEKIISNTIIKKFMPWYNPSKYITDKDERLTVKEWVKKYQDIIPSEDILFLLLRKEFMSERDLRVFAIWCAKKALGLVKNPDKRSIKAYNIIERYTNGQTTTDKVAHDARIAANSALAAAGAAYRIADYVAYYAALSVANAALSIMNTATVVRATAGAARTTYYTYVSDVSADSTFRTLQINQLLTYFE